MSSTLVRDETAMLTLEAIGPNTSLREIITAYPVTVELFSRYGLMGCGGARGPDEPLQWFAEVHHINPQTLLSEVKHYIREKKAGHVAALTPEIPQEKALFKRFIYAALLFTLTGGVMWGVINLTIIALQHGFPAWLDPSNEAHGHIQIFGWVSLFIMGVAYHVVPRMKSSTLWNEYLAEISFVLMTVGVLLRGVFQPLMTANSRIMGLVITSALFEWMAISLFVLVIAKTLKASTQPSEGFEKYLAAGSVWFWLMGAANLGIIMTMASLDINTIPVVLNWSLRHLQLDGFIAMFIFGIGRRTVGVFLGKRMPNQKLDSAIFYALNLAIVGRIAADLMMHAAPTTLARMTLAVSAAVELLAILGFVYNLHVFEKPNVDLNHTPLPRDYEKFVYQSYGWLVVATIMIAAFSTYQAITTRSVPHAMMGAYRHALTVGFITLMIMGYANRILPVFTGNRIYSTRLLNASFVLITMGNFLRVTFQSLTVPFGEKMFLIAGISGYFELMALFLFAFNLGATIQGRGELRVAESTRRLSGPISTTWSVAQVLNSYPQTLDVFLNFGFDHLRNPILQKTMAHTVTVEQAARIKNIDPALLLATLNQVRAAVRKASAA